LVLSGYICTSAVNYDMYSYTMHSVAVFLNCEGVIPDERAFLLSDHKEMCN